MLLARLIYAMTHMTTYTADLAVLKVDNNDGLIIRHVSPPYSARFEYPLYNWPLSKVALKLTDTPFAAIFSVGISYIPWSVLPRLCSPSWRKDRRSAAGWCAAPAGALTGVALLIVLAMVALRRRRALAVPPA